MKIRLLNFKIPLFFVFIFGIFSLDGANGQFDANFTLQNIWGHFKPGLRSIIQCISSDENTQKLKITRKLNTGQGPKLPKFSQQFLQGKPTFARILYMPSDDRENRFGVYQCKVVNKGIATEIVTLKLPPDELTELDAAHPYLFTNIDQPVELEVNVVKKLELPVKWRHDGVEVPEWDDQLKVTIPNPQKADAGVYECYYEERREKSVHALMRLIVRGCPEGLYGEKCDQECPPCYNGGICHEKWGVCVCPPGFMGLNCETACGGNHFGADCTRFCATPQNNSLNLEEACAMHVICKPDPYGCSCASGFKGPHCMDNCEPGWYGADCKQPCHCAYGATSCNRITGTCDGGCAKGWRGSSCQIDDPNADSYVETTTRAFCPLGTFGPSCEKFCHCAENQPCNVITGKCPSGCEGGWSGPTCSVCRDGRFGDNCESDCHCEGGHRNCDKDGYCFSGCIAGWAGFTCQDECMIGRFGPNCASTCHCQGNASTTCDKITGVCEGDCEPGYMGLDCQTLCPQDKYGVNCMDTCICSNDGECSRIDGSCSCNGRWRGTICNESEPQIVAAKDEEVNSDQQVFISCTADAVPEPEMNISSSDFPGLMRNVRNLDHNQYQAVMKIKTKHKGKYEFMCIARNPHGFDMKIMTLTVIEPPQLKNPPLLMELTNTTVKLKWSEWLHSIDIGGKAGDDIHYMVFYRKIGSHVWMKGDGWNKELNATLEDLEPNTLYDIAVKCRRPGKGGDGDLSPILQIKTECGVPLPDGIPREFLPEKISQRSVSLTWQDPPEELLRCPLIGYVLKYYNEANRDQESVLEWDAATSEIILDKLLPNTRYVLRLYPVTKIEKSKYFTELSITTLEAVPGPVTHLECQAVEQPDLLLVSWEEPVELNGIIRGYTISYELLDRGQCGIIVDPSYHPDMLESDPKDTEITLENLYPFSTYNVSVRARTSAGEGDASSLLATTSESSPSIGPQKIYVTSITSTSLEFKWEPIPCELSNGDILKYEYTLITSELGPEPAIPIGRVKRHTDIGSAFTSVEALEVLVKDLLPYVEYGFAVRGVTRIGPGIFSDFIFQRTAEDVPSQPRALAIDSATADELGISWAQPVPPNGQIISYRIQVWNHDVSSVTADIIFNVTQIEVIHEEDRIIYLASGLKPATNYFIKIKASTSVGWGEWASPISGRTLDGIPGSPAEILLLDKSKTELNISWKPPLEKNGIITAYKISYRPINSLDPSYNASLDSENQITVNNQTLELTLTDLHPSTQYFISVSSKTVAGYGSEASISAWTIILGEHVSPTVRTLMSEATNETIPILFSTTGRSSIYKYQVIVEDFRNDAIDEDRLSGYETAVVEDNLPYYITAELDPSNISDSDEHLFIVGDQKNWGGYNNVHLNAGHQYKIRIRTLVRKDDKKLKSILSDPKNHTAETSVYKVNPKPKKTILGQEPIVFILILISSLVLLIIIIFCISVWICSKRARKKSTNSYATRDSGISESLTWSVMYKVPEHEAVDGPLVTDGYKLVPLNDKIMSLKKSKTDGKPSHGVRIENLPDLLNTLNFHQHVAEEFKRLVDGQTSPWTIARKSSNLKKNRYAHILPYDRNRVILYSQSSNESDYINASYINGYRRNNEYIVTQGPLENTIEDFWKMIWQESCPVIVMLTDLVEKGKVKCAKYWPEDSMISGKIQILLIRTEEYDNYIVRTILLRKMDEGYTHRVDQYEFLGWPDGSVPSNISLFVKFFKRIRNDHPVLGGPMVVHCSAGAGRSGTFVSLDALCLQAEEDKRVDIFKFVNNARHQRIQFVQTLEQYVFIYEAIAEAMQYEDTSIPLTKIGTYLNELSHYSTMDRSSLIMRQYNKLNKTQKKIDVSRCSAALSEGNIFKNRDPLLVPVDSARIILYNHPNINLDYINAVIVEGYRKKKTYIVTQMPLTHTVADFWHMIYQHRSSFILMLNGCDENDDFDMGIYWPEYGECLCGDFEVQLVTFEDQGDYIIRIMRLINTNKINEEPHKVVQLQYKGWSFDMKPATMIKLINTVDLWYQRAGNGPITVHCMDGATDSGLFIAANYIFDQMQAEESLDVYQVVKSIRINRPEFIPNVDQFRICFEIAQEIAEPIIMKKVETSYPAKKISFYV